MFNLTQLSFDWVPVKVKAARRQFFNRKNKAKVYPSFSVSFTVDTDVPFGTLQSVVQEMIRELERKFTKTK